MYNAGQEGLPYELIINSNPSIAYLMVENPLYLQVLIMAHCVGHSDFFKMNRTFKDTDADMITAKFRSARSRIQKYIEDPSIGIEKVEKLIDACHSIQYQIDRRGRFRRSERELVDSFIQSDQNTNKKKDLESVKFPIEPEYDILLFLLENCKALAPWQKDVLEIIRYESLYFMPQIRTKIMNEGWASFWHYRILQKLNLPDDMHIPFIRIHNLVLRPWGGAINPYHLGFELFKKIEEERGIEECFLAREVHNDESFIMQYLDREICERLNLFTYSMKSRNGDWTIDDLSDEDGWKEIRATLLSNVAGNGIPTIYVDEVKKDTLILRHEHDGRDLELDYAENCVRNIKDIWGGPVKLLTKIEDEDFEI
jgi:stage V sporulation protein R